MSKPSKAKKPRKRKPAKPAPQRVDRVAFLEAWSEGAAIVEELMSRLDAVIRLFHDDPNHPDTFWIDARQLNAAAGSLERAMMDLQAGPLLSSLSIPQLVTEATDRG